MFLFLDISIVFLCLLYFPVDLEVFLLRPGHVKKSLYNTIQYNLLKIKCICMNLAHKCDVYFQLLQKPQHPIFVKNAQIPRRGPKARTYPIPNAQMCGR